jgi:hypothetical protein
VSDGLLPLGDETLERDDHLRFLDHIALLHATFWDWRDDLVLTPRRARYAMFSPAVAEAEAAIGSDPWSRT